MATLAAGCSTSLAAPNADQTEFSAVNSKELIDANSKRSLRCSETIFGADRVDKDDEGEVDSVDDEERGGKTLAQNFAKWHAKVESADDVYYQRFMLELIVRKAYKNGNFKSLNDNGYYRKWAAYSAWLKSRGYK
ncbi:hypothetical protein F444_18547 [Phytophthora nicotianae P1976]|nr:hypothetical protein F444_18547 [Phytophthora nicotianae P1976]